MARGGIGGGRGGSRGGGISRGGTHGGGISRGPRSSSTRSRGMGSGPSSHRGPSGGPSGGPRPGGPRPHGGHHRPPRPPRPPRHHHHHHHHGRTYYSGRRGGGGCSSVLAVVILLTIVGFYLTTQFCSATLSTVFGGFAGGCSGGFNSSSVQSTKNREKLDKGLLNLTDEWYTDEADIIEDENKLLRGMQVFYEETGIQPYLYVVEGESNATDAEVETIAYDLYYDLFTDEGHMLICYFINDNGDDEDFYYMETGTALSLIIDEEAEDIFKDVFWKKYYNENYTYEEFLGETFSDAGREIMDKPIPWTTVAIVVAAIGGVIIVIIILVKFWKARTAQKNKEQEDLERMLDKPLETFGDEELDEKVDDLKEKYDDADGKTDDADKTE